MTIHTQHTRYPRGKPASPARPGKLIKEVLMGQRPLVSGDLVKEAAIVDLHNVYKNFIYEQNMTRAKGSKLKGMVYSSFLRLFKFAQLLDLVTLVREEPMLFPPGKKNLYSVRKRPTDGTRVFAVISKRRVFKLSELGKADELSWTDLCRAWRENWSAPQAAPVYAYEEEEVEIEEVEKAEEVEEAEQVTPIPIPTPKVAEPPKARTKKRGRPSKKAVKEAEVAAEAKIVQEETAKGIVIPTMFEYDANPSKEQYIALLDQLNKLNIVGIDNKRVEKRVDKLADVVGEWVVNTIESLQDAQDAHIAKKIMEYRFLRITLTELDEALLDRDIPQAIEVMAKLVK